MPTGKRRNVVIVGAGFGGLAAARACSRAGVDVTLIDRNNHHLFQPLLYQVATAALSPGDIAQPIRSILRHTKNVRVVMASVESIDLENRTVTCTDGRHPYDSLILAPGSRHAYFGHDEWEAHAPGLKDLTDALHIRERLLASFEEAEQVTRADQRAALLTFVVVGGGPTGVELAGSIAEISMRTMLPDFPTLRRSDIRVVLIQAADRVLESFHPPLSAAAARSLEKLGVELLLDQTVTDVTANGVQVGGRFLYSRNVIWAAGNAASPLVRMLGVPVDRAGRAIVEADCSVPGHPDVFVIGDAAHHRHGTEAALPGVAQVAMQMGAYVARQIGRNVPPAERKPFRYRDLGTMATIGRASAVADLGGWRFTGLPAWSMWAVLHVMQLISFRNRFKVMIEWLWYYLSFQPGARLIVHRNASREIHRWLVMESSRDLHRHPPVERP